MLSRSLFVCQSLTLNVMTQVSQFVSNSHLCHYVIKNELKSVSGVTVVIVVTVVSVVFVVFLNYNDYKDHKEQIMYSCALCARCNVTVRVSYSLTDWD